MKPVSAGDVLYKVEYFSGKVAVRSATVKRVTPQFVWFEARAAVFGYRSRIDRGEAEKCARSPMKAAERWLEKCAIDVEQAQGMMAKAVALLDTVA